MACRLVLKDVETHAVFGAADACLTEREAIEDLELYRDRIVAACNQTIRDLEHRIADGAATSRVATRPSVQPMQAVAG